MISGAYGLSALVLVLGSNACGAAAAEPLKDSPFKEVQPGILQLADVRIDTHRRTVSFPAVLNLRAGQMEYFLVSTWGKVHESILRTETEPYHIHAAMLLLGAKGMGANEDEIIGAQGPFIIHPSSVRLPGDKITLTVKWKADGKEVRHRAEELVFNAREKSVLGRGHWVYTGSFLDDDSFAAQREGSIVSLVTDPQALINNTGPGHDDDSIWTVNSSRLPPAEVRAEVIIKLVKIRPEKKRP